MNRAEVRAKESLPEVEGLEEFIVPSNMTLISIDGELVSLGGQNGPSGTTEPAEPTDPADNGDD